MNNSLLSRSALLAAVLLSASGCTVHPQGEARERQNAVAAGKVYEKSVAPLAEHPTPDDLVRFALLANADVEQAYWQWRAAIEQVPIDGTQSSSLAISVGTTLNEGAFSADRTVLTAANDPMSDIAFPGKLSAAAQRSLENARAAGLRFRKAQFEMREKVLSAYDDYASNAEMIRLSEENVQLLRATASVTAARSRSGVAGQQDVLKARDDVDLALNDIENMRSQLPVEQAVLNALLSRPPAAAIPRPDSLPPSRSTAYSDEELLDLAARRNPELIALADEIRAKRQDIRLARLQYYPDFDLAASTDLKGITQMFLGEFTIPFFRYEALDAAVAQAQANLRAAEAMRRQTGNDLAARIVDDVATLRDADRQIGLFTQAILPRARQIVALARTAYQSDRTSLLDVLDSQRSLIDVQRLLVTLQITRDKRLIDIEAIDAGTVTVTPY